MAKRHPNYRRVKIHHTYTVDDLANLFGIHKNTVRAWQRSGLDAIDDRRPTLFRGDVVAIFLKSRRESKKTKLGPGELYCLPCRASRRPAFGMVDYIPLTPTNGNLQALCPVCERFMHRRCNHTRIELAAGNLRVRLLEAEPTL